MYQQNAFTIGKLHRSSLLYCEQIT